MPKTKIETTHLLRIGKDEMNFVENPIGLLSDRTDPNVKTLKFTRMVEGKNGQMTESEWTITGSDEYGLPVSGDEDVYLVLLEMTREMGFASRTIPISRYAIVERLGLPHNGSSYQRVRDALNRLVGTTYYANRWYERSLKKYASYSFHMLERVVLLEEQPGRKKERQVPLRLSSITWDEIIFKSFEDGYLKNLDLATYFSLKSPIAKRLYRLLDKRFYDGKPKFEINLRVLAHENLGLSRNYKYDSKIKANMERGHQELVAAGCISRYEYRDSANGLIIAYFPPKKALPSPDLPSVPELLPQPKGIVETLRQAGVSSDIAISLAEQFPNERILEKLSFLPYADAKNPGGWLRRAIEGDWQAPPAFLQARQSEEQKKRRTKKTAEKQNVNNFQETFRDEVEERLTLIRSRLSPEELEDLEMLAVEAYFIQFPTMRRTLGPKMSDPEQRRKVAGGTINKLLLERHHEKGGG